MQEESTTCGCWGSLSSRWRKFSGWFGSFGRPGFKSEFDDDGDGDGDGDGGDGDGDGDGDDDDDDDDADDADDADADDDDDADADADADDAKLAKENRAGSEGDEEKENRF